MSESLTDAAVLQELGRALARLRLDRNQTQEELAREAGVSRATVHRLESGASTQLTNLVRILRALGQDPDLAKHLAPAPPVRPLDQLRGSRDERRRQRARPPKQPRPKKPWTWGPEE